MTDSQKPPRPPTKPPVNGQPEFVEEEVTDVTGAIHRSISAGLRHADIIDSSKDIQQISLAITQGVREAVRSAIPTHPPSPPPGFPPSKKFIGVTLGGWVLFLAGLLVTGIGSGFWAFLDARDAIRDKPNTESVKVRVDKAIDLHERRGEHPKLEEQMRALSAEQSTIKSSQIRQEQIDQQQTEVLKEIQKDVRRIGRNH